MSNNDNISNNDTNSSNPISPSNLSLVSKKKLDNESFVAALNREEVLYESLDDVLYKKKIWKIIVKKSSIIAQQKGEDKPFSQFLISDTIVGVNQDVKDQKKIILSCCIVKSPEPETRKLKTFTFQFKSDESSKSFIDAVDQHILEKLPGKHPKYRRIRVILNPKSGKKASESIFKEVSALFHDAKVHLKKTITRGPEHAKKIGYTFDYKKYDTIVFISGDGLFHEFINGLLARDDWIEAKKINLALIPGGTGNGLACSIGLSDPMSAALAIIRGYARPLDISVIQQGDKKWCSILSLTWGLISDVDIESEKYRYLGPLRLQIGAAIRILMLRVYKGKILFQPVIESTKQDLTKIPKCSYECEICISNKPDQLLNSYVNNVPVDNSHQEGEVNVNLNFNISSPSTTSTVSNEDDQNSLESASSSSTPVTSSTTTTTTSTTTSTNSRKNSINKEKKNDFERIDIPTTKIPNRELLMENESVLLENGWKVFEGEFIGVVASTVSHLAPDYVASPSAHLNDGNIDLVFIKHTESFKKTDLLSILTESSSGKHLENHLIEHFKVKALILEPGKDKEGIIAVDGELIPYGRTSMECMRGCINLICRSH